MSTLVEIERAAGALSPSEKQELFLFLAKCLRTEGVQSPEPRNFSSEQIQEWIKQDENDWQNFKRIT